MTELSPDTLELLRRGREGAPLNSNRRNRLKTTILAQIAATAVAPAAAAGVASSAAATGTLANATSAVVAATGAVAPAAVAGVAGSAAVTGAVATASAGWTSFLTAVIVGMSGTAVGAGIIHWASAPAEQKPTATVMSEPHNAPVHKSAASKLERHVRSDDESSSQRIEESASQSASDAYHDVDGQHSVDPRRGVDTQRGVDGQHSVDPQLGVDAPALSVAEPRTQQAGNQSQREETRRETRARRGTDKPLSASEQVAANSESPIPESLGSKPPPMAAEALKEEAQLLRQAHDALSSGNATEALKILERCAARFPSGALAPERSAERIFALCRAGRLQEARLAADEFLRTYPLGPLAARVSSSCVGSAR